MIFIQICFVLLLVKIDLSSQIRPLIFQHFKWTDIPTKLEMLPHHRQQLLILVLELAITSLVFFVQRNESWSLRHFCRFLWRVRGVCWCLGGLLVHVGTVINRNYKFQIKKMKNWELTLKYWIFWEHIRKEN